MRGRGLLLAVEFDGPARAARSWATALDRGVIALLSGDDGRVLSFAPPLSIEREILELALDLVGEAAG